MSFLESDSILLHELITYGNNKLDTSSLSNSKKEIEWFLEDQLSISFYDIKFNKNHKVYKKDISLFLKFIKRRLTGEPFQYIINNANFYGYDFFVNKKNATFNDMKKLIDFVKINVKEKTGINLDLEIEIID